MNIRNPNQEICLRIITRVGRFKVRVGSKFTGCGPGLLTSEMLSMWCVCVCVCVYVCVCVRTYYTNEF